MVTRVPYQGTALPGAAETVVLYDSTITGVHNPPASLGAGKIQGCCLRWICYSIHHDEAATVNGSFRRVLPDGTLSPWRPFYTQALTAGALASSFEAFIEPYDHVKLELVNGGAAQTEFDPQVVLTDERSQVF